MINMKMKNERTNNGGPEKEKIHQRVVLDLESFLGDLTTGDDDGDDDAIASDDKSLEVEGLEQELQECNHDQVVANILSKGTKIREYTKGVEGNLRQVELESIEDYIKESDNLISLHDQIRDCDIIFSQMETLLSGFQLDIATSSDLIGVEARSSSLFSRGREPLKNCSALFALGERINILKEIDEPPLIPHIAEASS